MLNSVQPDFKTGGEALAEMLLINSTLTELDLSWNSIRLESAIALGTTFRGIVEWSGVEWSGVECSGVQWSAVECSGVEWVVMQCRGEEWSGVEWNGMEWNVVDIVKAE